MASLLLPRHVTLAIGAMLVFTPMNLATGDATDEQANQGNIFTDFQWKSARFSPDGRFLATCGGGHLVLWDIAKQQRVNTISLPEGVFSPDGRMLASGFLGGDVVLWEAATGKKRTTLQGHRCAPGSICFTPDGKTLVTAGGDNMVRVWDVATGKPKATFRFPYADRLFDPSTDRLIKPEQPHERAPVNVTFKNAIQQIYGMALSPDGKLAAVSPGYPVVVPVFDIETGKMKIAIDTKHGNGTTTVAFAPDGKTLVTGGCTHRDYGTNPPEGDGTLRFWDLETGKRTAMHDYGENKRFKGQLNATHCLGFSADGKLFFVGMPFDTSKICRTDTKAVISKLPCNAEDMDLSPDGKLAVTIYGLGKLKLWDVASAKEKPFFQKKAGSAK